MINKYISELIEYGIRVGLIEECDRIWAQGALIDVLSLDDYTRVEVECERELHEILDDISDFAAEHGLIEYNSVVYRDLFDTNIMGILMPRTSEFRARFKALYEKSPRLATDMFYEISKASNYIRTDRVARDMKWQCETDYGTLDITINLSKPEKDPKAIAAAKNIAASGYPKCALCPENEGYSGNVSKAARQNLRLVPITIGGEEWYLQYSPYVYYNEHCIALSAEHKPMAITGNTFRRMLDFIDVFPEYFIGSNADLPIVGGSILSHDHMQGGRYTFAMERAPIEREISFLGYEGVSAGIVRWPLSVIRLASSSKDELVALATKILAAWRKYTDEAAYIFAESDGVPHNTITPIARRRGELFELDLVLRNNITTEEHPLGLYHPHSEHHNIKKENIGLIEVMGLAVLPARLKSEMARLESAIRAGEDIRSIAELMAHADWVERFIEGYDIKRCDIGEMLRAEIGKTFTRVLEDAGVYKCDNIGRDNFLKFIDFVNKN